MVRFAPALLALALGGGCSPAPATAPSATPVTTGDDAIAPSPDARFVYLEDRLLGAETLSVELTVVATGAHEADVEGVLEIARGNRVALGVTGTFGGDMLEGRVVADGQRAWIRTAGREDTLPCPPALAESLVVGLTRMGILHNVARLHDDQMPDHAAGGARDWARTTGHRLADDGDSLVFALVVAGEPSGEATLSFDAGGLPTRREQVVRFPQGEMRVVETYTVRVDEEILGDFEVPGPLEDG